MFGLLFQKLKKCPDFWSAPILKNLPRGSCPEKFSAIVLSYPLRVRVRAAVSVMPRFFMMNHQKQKRVSTKVQ